ncbi:MAG: LD-carboxypeptidase [Desulfobacteraceae bacterium]|nr:LD-carboxypeptidase [Desulfobacteraceae bacterium]
MPPYLKPGDAIGVCAPSGVFDPVRFEAGLSRIRDMGFEIHLPPGLGAQERYLAGDDAHRAGIVNDLFQDSGIKAILCARGGFGVLRILPHLNFSLLNRKPKFLVGFSDITALLAEGVKQCPFPMIHGPVVTSLAQASRESVESLLRALSGPVSEVGLVNGKTIRRGRVSGLLAGGNLATLTSMAGTRFQPDFNGCILFLEDINEPPYKVDRMLTQMGLSGLLAGVRGVVLGGFDHCGDEAILHDIVQERFNDPRVPILAGLDAGHGAINLSLPLGAPVTLDADTHRLIFAPGGMS